MPTIFMSSPKGTASLNSILDASLRDRGHGLEKGQVCQSGKRLARLYYPYAVICVAVVHVPNFILRHVAGNAVLFANGTRGAGMIRFAFRAVRTSVAIEAAAVVSSRFTDKRLMWIVAGHAGEPGISPATATLEPIGVKSDVRDSGGRDAFRVPPGGVWHAPQKSTRSTGFS